MIPALKYNYLWIFGLFWNISEFQENCVYITNTLHTNKGKVGGVYTVGQAWLILMLQAPAIIVSSRW